jgi:hypothetical protein
MSVLFVPLYIGRAVLSFLIRLPAVALMLVGCWIWKLANWVSPVPACEERPVAGLLEPGGDRRRRLAEPRSSLAWRHAVDANSV